MGNNTLKRFFVLHFTLPYVMILVMVYHVAALHETGSSNPINIDVERAGAITRFHSHYTVQDTLGFVVLIFVLFNLCVAYPDLLQDPVNWIPADPYRTPAHIQPEWYFLFAYSILRRCSTKTGGVLALVASVAVLFVIPFYPKPLVRGVQFDLLGEFVFWCFIRRFIVLTYAGSGEVGYPYDVGG